MLFTELIMTQAKTLGVMAAAGIMVETLWQLKRYMWHGVYKAGNTSAGERKQYRYISVLKYVLDMGFWILAAMTISMFLYYSAYGKLSVHALLGFLIGFLLWKLFLNKALKFTLL